MPVELIATIGAALGAASAAIDLCKSVAEVVSREDRRIATRLAGLMGVIHTDAADVRNFLKIVRRAKTREAKDRLLSLALGKIEQMLLAIRDMMHLLMEAWSRPGLGEKILQWLKKMRRRRR
mgnify:CR=1 FL=1